MKQEKSGFGCRTEHNIRLFIYGTMTLLIMALIFFFSAQNGGDSRELSDGLLKYCKDLIDLLPVLTGKGASNDIRKYAHISEYFLLGVSSSLFISELFFYNINRRLRFKTFLISFLFCVLYAFSDEFHQMFVPGRAANFTDIVFDSLGAIAGIIFISLMRHCKPRTAYKEER